MVRRLRQCLPSRIWRQCHSQCRLKLSDETETKQFRNSFVSVSFQLCGQFKFTTHRVHQEAPANVGWRAEEPQTFRSARQKTCFRLQQPSSTTLIRLIFIKHAQQNVYVRAMRIRCKNIDYISVRSYIKLNHTSNKIVKGPVDRGTPRPAIMILH